MSRAWLIIRWCSVVFVRLPSRVRLASNAAVDIAANAPILLPVSNLTVPHSDNNSIIRSLLRH